MSHPNKSLSLVDLSHGGTAGSSGADAEGGGDGLSEFPTYEDYLDSQILPEDIKYLEVRATCTPSVRESSIEFLLGSVFHFLILFSLVLFSSFFFTSFVHLFTLFLLLSLPLLQSEDLMRQLVELGYRGSGEALKRSVRNEERRAEIEFQRERGATKWRKRLEGKESREEKADFHVRFS